MYVDLFYVNDIFYRDVFFFKVFQYSEKLSYLMVVVPSSPVKNLLSYML